MNTWQDHPAIDLAMVRTLVNAVGFDAFDGMRGQFVDDLKSLVVAYKAATDPGRDLDIILDESIAHLVAAS